MSSAIPGRTPESPPEVAPARKLDARQLGLPAGNAKTAAAALIDELLDEGDLPAAEIAETDPVYQKVLNLFNDGFGGVILLGPPGTGKSWYARQIAARIAKGKRSRSRFVQFHPSYQYEDFVEAYDPTPNGSFELNPRHLRAICEKAADDPEHDYVLVIDELSRCDAVRVFGEALTYLEQSLRDTPFVLASGTTTLIPRNLRIVATMNPWDRGVDEIDLAFERRFGKIALDPDAETLRKLLNGNGCPAALVERVVAFFNAIQALPDPYARIGHAYFRSIKDLQGLERLWNHQLKFHFDRTLQMDTEALERIRKAWNVAKGAVAAEAAAAHVAGGGPVAQPEQPQQG